MVLADSHCHLYSPEFDADRDTVLRAAFDAGVQTIILPNIDLSSVQGMLDLADRFPGQLLPAMGLHPCSVGKDFEAVLAQMRSWFSRRKFAAIGETGIDLYWDTTYKEQQVQSFGVQLQWAKEMRLPIIIHVRNSFEETLNVVDQHNDEGLTGVFHCFSGNLDQAKHILGYGGFRLGIGGVVTFKNSGLADVLKHIDLQHLVLETDAPYLAPAPNRGKRNDPSQLTLVAEKLAEIYRLPAEEIAGITTENTKALFHC